MKGPENLPTIFSPDSFAFLLLANKSALSQLRGQIIIPRMLGGKQRQYVVDVDSLESGRVMCIELDDDGNQLKNSAQLAGGIGVWLSPESEVLDLVNKAIESAKLKEPPKPQGLPVFNWPSAPKSERGETEDFIGINEKEAERLGLARVELQSSPETRAAQELLMRVADQTRPDKIDITIDDGKREFLDAWKAGCPNLPRPVVPLLGDWFYLEILQERRIVTNLIGDKNLALLDYDRSRILLVDGWPQLDFDDPNAATSHQSALLKELLEPDNSSPTISAVNISRETIDAALWKDSDPVKREQTANHRAIINKLGLDPNQYELRLITYEEYARLSTTQLGKDLHSGATDLLTHFEHYFLGDDGDRNGLSGGRCGNGGLSNVGHNWRDDALALLAVRLVLARKQKRF